MSSKPLSGRRPWTAIAGAVLGALLFASNAAYAQTDTGQCTEASRRPSFALTDANRLPLDKARARLSGKQLSFIRVDARGGSELRFGLYLRADGSFTGRCEWRDRGAHYTQTQGWQPCNRMTKDGGSRDVGLWRLDASGALCMNRTASSDNRSNDCYSIHEQGGMLALKVVSGPYACLPGDITAQ